MIPTNDKKVYYELSEILKYLEDDLKNKIPKEIIRFLEENKAVDYTFSIDFEKGIDEQKLLPETQELLTILYRDFLCDDSEKTLINSIIEENEKNYKQEQKKKYAQIFENSATLENNDVNSKGTEITVKEDSFFKRILNKIKTIFRLKK